MLNFRIADISDVELLYNWANEPSTRANSYNKGSIDYAGHERWFFEGLKTGKRLIYIFANEENSPVGQVRIEEQTESNAVISISVDIDFRKNGYAVEMLKAACADFKLRKPDMNILAYIFVSNIASYKCFIKAGFKLEKEEIVNEIPSYILVK